MPLTHRAQSLSGRDTCWSTTFWCADGAPMGDLWAKPANNLDVNPWTFLAVYAELAPTKMWGKRRLSPQLVRWSWLVYLYTNDLTSVDVVSRSHQSTTLMHMVRKLALASCLSPWSRRRVLGSSVVGLHVCFNGSRYNQSWSPTSIFHRTIGSCPWSRREASWTWQATPSGCEKRELYGENMSDSSELSLGPTTLRWQFVAWFVCIPRPVERASLLWSYYLAIIGPSDVPQHALDLWWLFISCWLVIITTIVSIWQRPLICGCVDSIDTELVGYSLSFSL